jgi:hypothetical protein
LAGSGYREHDGLVGPPGDSTIELVAVIISAAALLVAATIAAVTAQLRLRAIVKAERERLDDQPAHDRELRDLEEVRGLIDEAAEKLLSGHDHALGAWGSLTHLDKNSPADRVEYMQKVNAALIDGLALYGLTQRVSLRLGAQHPVTQSFWQARVAFQHALRLLQGLPPDESRPEIAAAITAMNSKTEQFIATAQSHRGARIGP